MQTTRGGWRDVGLTELLTKCIISRRAHRWHKLPLFCQAEELPVIKLKTPLPVFAGAACLREHRCTSCPLHPCSRSPNQPGPGLYRSPLWCRNSWFLEEMGLLALWPPQSPRGLVFRDPALGEGGSPVRWLFPPVCLWSRPVNHWCLASRTGEDKCPV